MNVVGRCSDHENRTSYILVGCSAKWKHKVTVQKLLKLQDVNSRALNQAPNPSKQRALCEHMPMKPVLNGREGLWVGGAMLTDHPDSSSCQSIKHSAICRTSKCVPVVPMAFSCTELAPMQGHGKGSERNLGWEKQEANLVHRNTAIYCDMSFLRWHDGRA